MKIDFSKVKSFMVPQGIVDRILFSGIQLWESPPVLETIHDFGTISTTASTIEGVEVNGYSTMTSTPFSNYDCTHVVVDGKAYKISLSMMINGITYTIKDDNCPLTMLGCGIIYNSNQIYYVWNLNFKESGSYNVQLSKNMKYTSPSLTITLAGAGSSSDAYVQHNGTTYFNPSLTSSFEVKYGDVIKCYVDESYDGSKITLNGTKVAEGEDDDAQYYHIVTKNTTITLAASTQRNTIDIVEAAVIGITITMPPTNTVYEVGDKFSTSGMVVSAQYDDGSLKSISGYTIIDGDSISDGQTGITISYTVDGVTFTTVQPITIAYNVHVSAAGEILDNWATISAGTFIHKYSIGNYKSFVTNNNRTITMRIVGFNLETSGSITWISDDIIFTNNMSSSSSMPSKAWYGTTLRSHLHNTSSGFYAELPTEIRKVLKQVTKTYYTGSGTSTSDDKLWIPSYREVFGDASRENDGPTYSSFFPTRESRIKNYNGTPTAWYLRSVNEFNNGFTFINAQGNYGTSTPDYIAGVLLCFCT